MFTKKEILRQFEELFIVKDTCDLCNKFKINMELFDVDKKLYRVSTGSAETNLFNTNSKCEVSEVTVSYEPSISIKEFAKLHSLNSDDISLCVDSLRSRGYIVRNDMYEDGKPISLAKLKNSFDVVPLNNSTIYCYISDRGQIIFLNRLDVNGTLLGLPDGVNKETEAHTVVLDALYEYAKARYKFANELYFIGVGEKTRESILNNLRNRDTGDRQIRVRRDINRYVFEYTDKSLDNFKAVGANIKEQRKEHWNK